jgi:CubicO group peptidase (beta-lactamase class C family)
VLRTGLLALPALPGAAVRPASARASSRATIPGREWERWARPEDAGFGGERLEAVRRMAEGLATTSVMLVVGGRVAWSLGDTAEVSYLASARKSILSMLYGRYVAEGAIDLDRTVGDIGLDDVQALLPVERTATLRHLLTATSGIYHPAGSPGGDAVGVPARGSHPAGSRFLYNNWDFNAAGAAFERLTGKTVFGAFATDLAAPLGLQDFDPGRQRMLGFPDRSRFLAYHFFLSGRDMARLGLVMARGGVWGGREVIPPAWVAESTRVHVPAARLTGPYRDGPLGYGYLWWVPEGRTAPEWAGAHLASGNYGQFILVLPAIDAVVVHRRAVSDAFAVGRNMGTDDSNPRPVTVGQFMRLAEAMLASRCTPAACGG